MDKLIELQNIDHYTIKDELIHDILKIHEKYIYLINNKENMTKLQIYRFVYKLNLYPKNIKDDKKIWMYYINNYYEIRKNIIIDFKIKNQNICALCNKKSKIMCSCLNLKYCSKTCYYLDWKEHKKDYSHKY